MLTNQTAAGLVQLFDALSQDAVRLLLIKHLDTAPAPFTVDNFLYIVTSAQPDAMTGLLVELVGGSTAVSANAPTKYVFDGRLTDLRRRLRADGFEVVEDALACFQRQNRWAKSTTTSKRRLLAVTWTTMRWREWSTRPRPSPSHPTSPGAARRAAVSTKSSNASLVANHCLRGSHGDDGVPPSAYACVRVARVPPKGVGAGDEQREGVGIERSLPPGDDGDDRR